MLRARRERRRTLRLLPNLLCALAPTLMPYRDQEAARACDRRYRQRHTEFRRASRRQWNWAHRPYCACRSCNQRKGAKSYASFIERMRAERGEVPLWVEEDEPMLLTGAYV